MNENIKLEFFSKCIDNQYLKIILSLNTIKIVVKRIFLSLFCSSLKLCSLWSLNKKVVKEYVNFCKKLAYCDHIID